MPSSFVRLTPDYGGQDGAASCPINCLATIIWSLRDKHTCVLMLTRIRGRGTMIESLRGKRFAPPLVLQPNTPLLPHSTTPPLHHSTTPQARTPCIASLKNSESARCSLRLLSFACFWSAYLARMRSRLRAHKIRHRRPSPPSITGIWKR
jgi:hypothetical protein